MSGKTIEVLNTDAEGELFLQMAFHMQKNIITLIIDVALNVLRLLPW